MDEEKIIDLFRRLEVLSSNSIYVEVIPPTSEPFKRIFGKEVNFLFGYRVSEFKKVYSKGESEKVWGGYKGEVSEYEYKNYIEAIEAGILKGEEILEDYKQVEKYKKEN